MKYVKEITFYNHYLFGNQTIKFYDHNGKTFNTIVIIGENGGGKTALINYLYDILIKDSYTSTTAIPKESKVTIENTDSKLESEPDSEGIKHIIDELIIHKNTQGMQNIVFVSDGYIVHGTKDSNNIHKYSVGGILTPAEISYIPTEDVRYVTSTTLDTAERYSEKDIAHSIEQLLVDIVNQDNQKIAKYAEDHRGEKIPESIFESLLINRFKNAYDIIFQQKLVFNNVKNNTKLTFKKNGREINIHDLSSGEKQIIYRSTYLLKNAGILKGSPVFIDEPEISMHPKWEKKIYSFYKKLYTYNEIQESQFFFATHSDYVIEEALKDDDAMIVSINNGKVKIIKKNEFMLPIVSSAEIKYHIFGIPTTDYHNQLYSQVEEKFKKKQVKSLDVLLLSKGAPKKKSRNNRTEYNTLPIYIRNAINHPNNGNKYTDKELQDSIKYLISVLK